jgi:TRAP-type C4-dicarboxylate transport system permease small subunit
MTDRDTARRRPDGPAMRAVEMLDKALAVLETIGIVALTLCALAIGIMQVALRYIFNTGISWSEGVFITFTIWAMLLAGSRAVRDGLHVRVDVGVRLLPAPLHRAAELVSLVAPLVLCSFFFYAGFLYTRFVFTLGTVSPEAQLPDWLIYGCVPLTMAAFVLRYLILIVRWARHEPLPGGTAGEGAS